MIKDNNLLKRDQISTVSPEWQHPVLPGHAQQGSLLLTTTDFVNPPQSQENFIWLPLEDLVGVHDNKTTYDQDTQTTTLYKSKAHLNADGTWTEEWYSYATIQGLPAATVELLNNLKYIEYQYTITDSSITFHGIDKNGGYTDLGTFQVYSIADIDEKISDINSAANAERLARIEDVTNLTTALNNEVAARTAADTNIQTDINAKVEYAVNYAKQMETVITTETAARVAGDTANQTAIQQEVTDRANADGTLQTQITNNYTTLNSKIDSIASGVTKTEVVDILPENPTNNTLYYVKNAVSGGYDMMLWTNETWYNMGSTTIDLSGYATVTYVDEQDTAINGKVNANTANISTNATNIATLTNGLAATNILVNQNTTNIATNTTNLTNLTTNVSSLTEEVHQNAADIKTNKPVAGDCLTSSVTTDGTTLALDGTTENWTFTLSSGTTVTKNVRVFA